MMRAICMKRLLPFLAAVLAALYGCAAVPVALLPVAATGVVAGASGGISYTFTNIAYRTTNFPMGQVAEASLKALDKMGIEVLWTKKSEKEVEIKSRTDRLTIYVTVHRMTPVLSLLEVNAKTGLVFKDKGTAFEIVYLTASFLQGVEKGYGAVLAGRPGTAAGVLAFNENYRTGRILRDDTT